MESLHMCEVLSFIREKGRLTPTGGRGRGGGDSPHQLVGLDPPHQLGWGGGSSTNNTILGQGHSVSQFPPTNDVNTYTLPVRVLKNSCGTIKVQRKEHQFSWSFAFHPRFISSNNKQFISKTQRSKDAGVYTCVVSRDI